MPAETAENIAVPQCGDQGRQQVRSAFSCKVTRACTSKRAVSRHAGRESATLHERRRCCARVAKVRVWCTAPSFPEALNPAPHQRSIVVDIANTDTTLFVSPSISREQDAGTRDTDIWQDPDTHRSGRELVVREERDG